MLSVVYRNAVGSHYAAYRIIANVEQKEMGQNGYRGGLGGA